VIDPGRLRERVTVQQATETRNRLGETVQSWATYAERWASVSGISAREFFLSGPAANRGDASHPRLRYLDGLNSTMRILWRGRVLEIASALEHNNRSEHELLCTERVD
jgi:SPP1 family predicted phage head-tail adaptor